MAVGLQGGAEQKRRFNFAQNKRMKRLAESARVQMTFKLLRLATLIPHCPTSWWR